MKLALLLLLAATPAGAAGLRDFCADRPGLGTPACIVDKGHLQVEAAVADFEHDHGPDTIADAWTAGDLLLRYGVTDRLEVIGGWTAYRHVRERDRASGGAMRSGGIGDLLFGLKQSVLAPDGKGFAVALQPFVTAPTAKDGLGAGGWTQGLIVPVDIDLPGGFELELTPEIDRLPNAGGRGHHAAYTGVVGLGHALGAVDAQVELYVSRDDDPGARTTQAIADLNLAWTVGDNLQFDAEVDAGLNRDTPDVRVAVGVSRRF